MSPVSPIINRNFQFYKIHNHEQINKINTIFRQNVLNFERSSSPLLFNAQKLESQKEDNKLKIELEESEEIIQEMVKKLDECFLQIEILQSNFDEKKEEIKKEIDHPQNSELKSLEVSLNQKSEVLIQEKGNDIDEINELVTCPITQELFNEPVVTPYGHTFEREAIEQWLNINNCCPLTKLPLSLNDLIPNFTLKQISEVQKKKIKSSY